MKRSSFIIALGGCFILSALMLTGYNMWADRNAENASRSALNSIIAFEKENGLDSKGQTDENVIPDYILNPEMDMPEVEIDGREYIGYLDIPTLNTRLPVLSELTDSNLNIAPCRYEGSVYLDNIIIAAHNFSSHFGYISDLKQGDNFTFTDIDGNIFSYEVVDFEVLRGNQVEDMSKGDWDLTMFTCTLDGGSRITVRCDRIHE